MLVIVDCIWLGQLAHNRASLQSLSYNFPSKCCLNAFLKKKKIYPSQNLTAEGDNKQLMQINQQSLA